MDDYIKVLQDELTDAQRRLSNCDAPEGQRVIERHIREIKRDIRQQIATRGVSLDALATQFL